MIDYQYDRLPQEKGAFRIQEIVEASNDLSDDPSPMIHSGGVMAGFGPFMDADEVERAGKGTDPVPVEPKNVILRIRPETIQLLDELKEMDGPQVLLTMADECFSRTQAEGLRLLVDGFVWCLAGLHESRGIGSGNRAEAFIQIGSALMEVSFPYRQSPLLARLRHDFQRQKQGDEYITFKIEPSVQPTPIPEKGTIRQPSSGINRRSPRTPKAIGKKGVIPQPS